MRVSKDEIASARTIDLLTYMQKHNPNNLERVSHNEWALKNHSSLKISNGFWYWFTKEVGGKTALDYLIKVEGVKFIEAVKHLNGLQGISIADPSPGKTNKFIPKEIQKQKKFELPKRAGHVRNVYAYLRSRGISARCINKCLNNKSLYQDTNNNAVFVGFKENSEPGYAFKRGTNTYKEFWGEQKGSSKEYGFAIKGENSKALKVFESAIDALSYYTLFSQNYSVNSYPHLLSLGGVSGHKDTLPKALEYYLKHNEIEEIGICFDNDETGRSASESLFKNLKNLGFTVAEEPPQYGKDYNDFLMYELQKKIEEPER